MKHLDIPKFNQVTTPATPPPNYDALYFKSDDNLYRLDSSGNEVAIGGSTTQLNTSQDNMILTNFRIQMASAGAYGLVQNGWADAYEYQGGIDTLNSVGQVYSQIGTYFTNGGVYLPQYPVPDAFHVLSTSFYNGGYGSTNYQAFQATDPARSLTGPGWDTQWYSDYGGETNQKFNMDLGLPFIITRIHFEAAHDSGTPSPYSVKNFELYGTNDVGAFYNTAYGDLTNLTLLTSGVIAQHVAGDVPDPQYFTFINSTSFQYYVFRFADNYAGYPFMALRRVELDNGGSVTNMTLISNPQVAQTSPTAARIELLLEDVDPIIINTDLMAYVSRDGTNYTQLTLSDVGYFDATKRILVGQANLTGPAGTSMIYKLTTANLKNLRMHGAGLIWE